MIAKGKKNGKPMTVVAEYNDGWDFTFNGEVNIKFEIEMSELLFINYPLLGTYWPGGEELKLAALLEARLFFDDGVEEITITDPDALAELEEVGSEDGVVY